MNEDDLFFEGGMITIPEREIERVRAELRPVLEAALAILVRDESSYRDAIDLSSECIRRAKYAEHEWEEPRKRADDLHKSITAKIKSVSGPLREAAKIVDEKAYQWKRAEDERTRIEAEKKRQAERKRIEDERLRQAEELAKAGAKDVADAIMAAPIEIPFIAAQTVAKIEGVTYRENWQFEITDAAAIPRDYLCPDLSKIGKVVKALKGTAAIPGVRVFDAGTTVHR